METANFSLGEAFKAIEYSPTKEQWKVLQSFGYKNESSFSVKVLEGIDAPPKVNHFIQASKPTNESILEKYLYEKHEVRISHSEANNLENQSRKLATTKSSKESTAAFLADWDPLAGKHGRQKAAIQAGTLATQRLAEASALATQAASKRQEITQWTQFAIAQDDFKPYKEQLIAEHETITAAAKQKHEEENSELLEARSHYDKAFRGAREEKLRSCSIFFRDWLNSNKYESALAYSNNKLTIELINYVVFFLEIAAIFSTAFLALFIIIPVHMYLLKDAYAGRWFVAYTNKLTKWSSLKPEWDPTN